MDKEQRHVAKAQLVAGMQTGQAWQTAAAQAGFQISQSNAYRLWLAVDATRLNLAALIGFGMPVLLIVTLTRGQIGYQPTGTALRPGEIEVQPSL